MGKRIYTSWQNKVNVRKSSHNRRFNAYLIPYVSEVIFADEWGVKDTGGMKPLDYDFVAAGQRRFDARFDKPDNMSTKLIRKCKAIFLSLI